jgi:hypothetical protein
LLEKADRQEMEQWDHGGGFSLDASVRIEAHDRRGLERLLRYCARPPFAADRLEEIDAQRLIYHLPKPGLDGQTQIILSPLELIGRIVALVPPPRQHRHRYYGVLAPNSPLRPAVTALAPMPVATEPEPVAKSAVETVADDPVDTIRRSPAHYLWVMLLARIYEVFPLTCPRCGAEMRIIAFITEAVDVRAILEHIGEPATPPRIASARGPPEWYEDSVEGAIAAEACLLGDPLACPPSRSTSTTNGCPGSGPPRGCRTGHCRSRETPSFPSLSLRQQPSSTPPRQADFGVPITLGRTEGAWSES